MRIGCYATHAGSDLFPLMSGGELAEDIRQDGLHTPIVIHHGRILDGRNRLLACLRIEALPAWGRARRYARAGPALGTVDWEEDDARDRPLARPPRARPRVVAMRIEGY